jgi:chaperonin GroEL
LENKVVYGQEARKLLKEGVDLVANAVKVTLGAKGMNVMCVRDLLLPIITKDGVSVSKEVESNDLIINAGASLVKQVSNETNEGAGDGTTTATVLAQAIVSKSDEILSTGVNPISLKRGLDLALDFSLKHLDKLKTKSSSLKTLKDIANISTNGDKEISDLVVDAIKKVSKNGTIKVEETEELKSSVELSLGYELDVPFSLAEFINDREKFEAVFEDMNVLIYQGHLKDKRQLNKAIELSTTRDTNGELGVFEGLLIICDNISGHVQKEILEFSYQGFKIMNLRSPSFGARKNETLKDIAALIGAKVYSEDLGDDLDNVTLEGLGHIDKVISDANKSVLIGGKGKQEEIKERTAIVKQQIKNITGGKKETEYVKERYSKLTKGVAVIKVGGYSAPEKREKTDRVEDALCAVKACLEEGYVAGGGVTYLNISNALKSAKIEVRNEDEQKGVEVLVKALEAPFKQILENAGMQDQTENYIHNIQSSQYYGDGIDLQTQEYVDLFKRGIIDPTKVERLALQNAVSISGTFLTLGAITYNNASIFTANVQK